MNQGGGWSTMSSPTIADVYRAREVVRRYLTPTPLLRSRGLSVRTGAEVFVKYENLSPIRSFKARGAIYCLSRLAPGAAGIACASTGNHGQGMALAATLFGRRAVVVVPEGANEQKMAAIRDLGADLRTHGPDLTAASTAEQRIAAEEGLVYVEDGEDPNVLIGCATLALEIVEQLPEFDDLLVPVGGGNLIAACVLVTKILRPGARVVGVQSTAAPAVARSWREGSPVRLDGPRTFAGGIATSYPGGFVFPLIRSRVDEMALVPDEELIEAAIVMLAETGHLPEGAGAAGLAALLADPGRYVGRRVVLILSGGNFEHVIWQRLTAGRDGEG
jgi:threonine dehydratase